MTTILIESNWGQAVGLGKDYQLTSDSLRVQMRSMNKRDGDRNNYYYTDIENTEL